MKKRTREEAIQYLETARKQLDKAKTKDEVLAVLSAAGDEVAYTPAFRCLVKGQEPAQSIRWRD